MAITDQLFEAQGEVALRADVLLRALDRIKAGTFGLCLTCEGPIEPDRLNRAPLTEECGRCARRQAHA